MNGEEFGVLRALEIFKLEEAIEIIGNVVGEEPEPEVGVPDELRGGLIRFSFCRRLQNQTRTTSFSMQSESASIDISSDVGFGFVRKAFSNATLTVVSMLVLFFRRRPIASA